MSHLSLKVRTTNIRYIHSLLTDRVNKRKSHGQHPFTATSSPSQNKTNLVLLSRSSRLELIELRYKAEK